jgi:hypothetical protein
MKKIVIAFVLVMSFVLTGVSLAVILDAVPPTQGSDVSGTSSLNPVPPTQGSDVSGTSSLNLVPPTQGSDVSGTSNLNPVPDPVVVTPTITSGSRSSGGSRSTISQGQVLGAQSTSWDNLSASQRADIIKQLLAQLAEIVKMMNAMIADGTLK